MLYEAILEHEAKKMCISICMLLCIFLITSFSKTLKKLKTALKN